MASDLAFRVYLAVGGDREVIRKLNSLEAKVRNRILRGTLRDALKPLHSASKAEAPTRKGRRGKRLKSGNLKKAIVLRKSTWAKGRRGLVGFEVSIGRKHRSFDGGPFYGSFVETGGRRGRGRGGRVKAEPYLRRPFRRMRGAIKADAMRRILWDIDPYLKGR